MKMELNRTTSADYPKRAKPIQKHDHWYAEYFRYGAKDLLNFTGYYSIKQINYANYTNNTYFVDGNFYIRRETTTAIALKLPEQNYTLYYRHRFKKGHELSSIQTCTLWEKGRQIIIPIIFIPSTAVLKTKN